MDDYIRREDATKALTKLATDKYSIEDWYESYINTLIDVDDEIKMIPPADVAEVIHGRWVVDNGCVCCSECGEPNMEWNYCPNCGARMDGDIE